MAAPKILCPQCGSPAASDARFCGTCGTPLAAAAPVVEPPTTPLHPAPPTDYVAPPAPVEYVALPTQQFPPNPFATPSTPAPTMTTEVMTYQTGAIVPPPPTSPFGAPPMATPPGQGGSKRGLIIALSVIAAVAVLAAGGVGVGFLLTGGLTPAASSDDERVVVGDTQDDEDEAEAAADPTASVPSGEPSTEPKVAPDPNGVVVRQFESPSGNIRCTFNDLNGEAIAACQQVLINYPKPASACTTGAEGVVVAVDGGGSFWPCLASNIEPAEVLPLDTATNYGGISCSINYVTGVTCVNSRGNGFTMEYDRGVQAF